jgi:thioredoxin 1
MITCTPDNLQEILDGDKPVILDFWAPWCGPCRSLSPILETLEAKYEGKAVIAKINVDDFAALAAKYQVQAIPTCLVFVGGKLENTVSGLKDADTFSGILDPLVA